MNMKKIIYLLYFLLLAPAGMWAQDKRLSRQEFENEQREYFIRQAGLTEKETEQFFPLYFELQQKKRRLNREAMEQMRKGKGQELTETEYAHIIETVANNRIACDELDLEYLRKYRKVLSAKKIYLLQHAEMKFHRELLKRAKKK